MILRSLELEQFGKLSGKTFEFRRGVNLVTGPNEVGKSTLAEAIPVILFGTKYAERFKPWGKGHCTAALVFEGDKRTVEVRRDVLTDQVRVTERDDLYHVLSEFEGKVPVRGRSAISKEYRDRLHALIGIAEEDLFRATYFFGHRPQEWTGDVLAEKLRELVGGSAEVDFAQIMDTLLEEHFDLTCENPWGRKKAKEGELERLKRQLAEFENEPLSYAETLATPEVKPIAPDDSELQELKDRIARLEKQLEEDRKEYAKGVRYIDHLREKAAGDTDLSVRSPEHDSRTESPSNRQQLLERLATLGLPDDLPPQLPEILDEATEIRKELAKTHQPLTALVQQEKRVARVPWLWLALAILVLSSAAGLALWFEEWMAQAFTVSTAGLFGVLAFGGWRYWQRQKTLAEIDEKKSRLERQRAVVQDRQTLLSERCDALGLPTSAVDLVRLQKAYEQNRALFDQLWNAEKSPSTEQPSVTPKPTPDDAPDSELRELEQKLQDFASKIKEKEIELEGLPARLSEQTAEEVVEEPTTEFGRLQKRVQEIEHRIRVLRKEIDLLARAVEDYGQSHMTGLVKEAARLFGKMTGDRYKELRLDEEMRPSVKISERRWVSADRLSRGTIDALYLALRVALAKVRSSEEMLPLVLDDPFVHLDRKRMKKALDLVDLVAADGQLILLSHHEELGRRAARERWHVITFDEETVEADEREGEDHAGQLHLL